MACVRVGGKSLNIHEGKEGTFSERKAGRDSVIVRGEGRACVVTYLYSSEREVYTTLVGLHLVRGCSSSSSRMRMRRREGFMSMV